MSNLETLPVKHYIVKNENTGKEYEFFRFESADNKLNELREERERANIVMYAVIDA